MNPSFLRNGNKVYHYINTLWMRQSLHDSVGVIPIHTSHVRRQLQPSKAFYYGRRTKEMEFSVPVRSFSTKTNGTTPLPSATNSGVIGWYVSMLTTRPILTKSITSALIYTAADLTSQTMTRSSSEPYDLVRTSRMAGFGLIILGSSLHYWYNFLSRLFPKQDLATSLKKMLMGQATYGPVMTALFFSVNAGLQGENGTEIVARLKRDMLPTLINNALYWPVCDVITFKFVPIHLQPLVSNTFAYIWTIYLTYIANLAKADNN